MVRYVDPRPRTLYGFLSSLALFFQARNNSSAFVINPSNKYKYPYIELYYNYYRAAALAISMI